MGEPISVPSAFAVEPAVSDYAVFPQLGTLEAKIYRDKDTKRCLIWGQAFVPKSNRGKYCWGCAPRVHRPQKERGQHCGRIAVCRFFPEDPKIFLIDKFCFLWYDYSYKS